MNSMKEQIGARRKKAAVVYTVFGTLATILCVLMVLAPDVPTQVGVLLIFGALWLVFMTVRRRTRIKGAFVRVREGVILEKEEHFEAETRTGIRGSRIHYTAGKTAIGMGGGSLIRTLAVDFNGSIREVRLPTPRHADLYLVGDRILVHPLFSTPLLLSEREAPHRGCAMCGAICPAHEGEVCRTCGAELHPTGTVL